MDESTRAARYQRKLQKEYKAQQKYMEERRNRPRVEFSLEETILVVQAMRLLYANEFRLYRELCRDFPMEFCHRIAATPNEQREELRSYARAS
jgi:hypothetical protein